MFTDETLEREKKSLNIRSHRISLRNPDGVKNLATSHTLFKVFPQSSLKNTGNGYINRSPGFISNDYPAPEE